MARLLHGRQLSRRQWAGICRFSLSNCPERCGFVIDQQAAAVRIHTEWHRNVLNQFAHHSQALVREFAVTGKTVLVIKAAARQAASGARAPPRFSFRSDRLGYGVVSAVVAACQLVPRVGRHDGTPA